MCSIIASGPPQVKPSSIASIRRAGPNVITHAGETRARASLMRVTRGQLELRAAGAVVLALSLRERDTANINPEEAVLVPGA
jgi:hypothetical protein